MVLFLLVSCLRPYFCYCLSRWFCCCSVVLLSGKGSVVVRCEDSVVVMHDISTSIVA